MTSTANEMSQAQSRKPSHDIKGTDVGRCRSEEQKQKEDSTLRKVGRKMMIKLSQQRSNFRLGSGTTLPHSRKYSSSDIEAGSF